VRFQRLAALPLFDNHESVRTDFCKVFGSVLNVGDRCLLDAPGFVKSDGRIVLQFRQDGSLLARLCCDDRDNMKHISSLRL
jgi:hypothetical protein